MPLPNSAAIKALRQAKGLSGVSVAAACGISHGHLFNMENVARRKHASQKVLTDLAATLGVPVDAITMPELPRQKQRHMQPAA